MSVRLTVRLMMYFKMPKSSPVSIKPEPHLTNLTSIDPKTDQRAWLERLYFYARMPYATVMHLCDIHYPFHHQPSLEVTYQLVQRILPEVIVVGSDAADFAMCSTFPLDHDEHDDVDVLDQFEDYWNEHIDRVREASPDSTLVYIFGNHDKRVYDYVMRNAPAVRETVNKRFIEIVRHGGDVFWLGDVDTVRMGPLLVTHGNRTGDNPAHGLWNDVGGQLSVMAGHVHRLSYYGKRGEEYMTEAITSGCLTNYPHYAKRKRSAKWELGTAIAEVNLKGREVNLTNLKYELEADRVWVRFERVNYEAPISLPTGAEPL